MPWRVHLKLRIFSGPQAPLLLPLILTWSVAAQPAPSAKTGAASWYGEAHRGKLMANGKPFNPDELTAASWFFPLQTRVVVTCKTENQPVRRVVVTVTDRGPSLRLVKEGRIIDLSRAAFEKLASPMLGLIEVSVRPERQSELHRAPAAIVSDWSSSFRPQQRLFCAAQVTDETRLGALNGTSSPAQKKLP